MKTDHFHLTNRSAVPFNIEVAAYAKAQISQINYGEREKKDSRPDLYPIFIFITRYNEMNRFLAQPDHTDFR